MSEKTKKKLWPKIVAAVLIAIVLLLILSLVFINSILKGAVETVGSTVTKSEVSIEKVKLSLLGGVNCVWRDLRLEIRKAIRPMKPLA